MNTYSGETLLSKILNYEEKIYTEWSLKRKELLENLKKIEINTLNNDQLLIFINDLKNVIDPLKTSIEHIDHFNSNSDFQNRDSINNSIDFQKIILLNILVQLL